MEANQRKKWSPLLPTGIAMMLGAIAFSIDPAGVQWLWNSQPWVALLLAVAGASMIGGAIFARERSRPR